MKKLNRRQWLRTAGIAGSLAVAGSHRLFALPGTAPSLDPPDSLVRLNANENPYAPSKTVREAMLRGFDRVCRYPYEERPEVRRLVAEREGVDEDHVLLTVGSREGLEISGMVYGMNGGEIVSAEPTFKALMSYAEHFGAFINRVPLDENLVHDLEEMERRITHRTSLVFVCNPNNPSGTLLPAGRLRDFCHSVSKRTVVFCDEAYFDYVTEPNYPTMVELVKEGANVIVSRTFSKVYGLAGIRIGYLVARPDIIARLRQVQFDRPNMLALFAAKATLQDHEFYRYSLEMNARARDRIYAVLDELGLRYVPSHTNFVFFHTGRPIQEIIEAMEKQGVRVGRPFPPLTDWCRVSTGTLEEMDRFGAALRKVMS